MAALFPGRETQYPIDRRLDGPRTDLDLKCRQKFLPLREQNIVMSDLVKHLYVISCKAIFCIVKHVMTRLRSAETEDDSFTLIFTAV